jgi:hypothetical protein
MTLRTRDGKTRVEPHAGHFMRRHLQGESLKITILAPRTRWAVRWRGDLTDGEARSGFKPDRG